MTSEDAFQKACISDEDNNDPTNGDGDEVSLRFKDWKHSRTMYLASVSVTKSTRAAGILSPSPSVVGADSSTQRAKKRKLRNGDAADGLGSTGCLIDIERSSLPFKSRTSSIVSSRQANRSVSKIPIELPYSPKSPNLKIIASYSN
ncbi:MAG: hypothetical protein M1814_002135 [Vezdaea aestivalis]|nr:MAG: hypothetical protein M1814_002135 [Vezdaea aestivalis]